MAVADDEKEKTAGQHDDLGVHPERREAEAGELEKRFYAPSAPPAKLAGASSASHVPEADRAVTRPNLQALEGGGEGDSQPAEAKSGKTKPATSEELQGAESAAAGGIGASQAASEAGSDTVGKGYTSASTGPLAKFTYKIAGSRNKKFLIGGAGAGAGIIGLLLLALFALIPLKIENIVQNLEKHFSSTTNNAVDTETDNMFKHYVEKYVAPALAKTCGTHTTKDCTINGFGNGNNPITNMYKSWSQANLDNLLANKGIEIDYNTGTRQYFLKAPDISDPNGTPISNPGKDGTVPKIDDTMFENASRGDVRQAVKDATKDESVLKRYKIGRFLEEKYGVKRCIIFCGTKDALADFKSQKKNAAQIYLVQRVITPHAQALGIVLECLLSSCNPDQTNPSTADTTGTDNGETVGEPENPDTDTKVRQTLENLAKSYGVTDKKVIQDLINQYEDAEKNGVSKTVLKAVLNKLGGEQLSNLTDQIADAAGAIQWINTVSSWIGLISHAGEKIKKLQYVTDSATAVSLFAMYQTYASEIHTGDGVGKVDATEVGSMVDSLGPGDHSGCTTGSCPSPDPEVGGTASAEQTPLYGALIDGNPSSVATTSDSSLISLLSPQVYAAAASDSGTATSSQPQYKCDDNSSVPSGSLVCPEEKLSGGNPYVNDVSNAINTGPLGIVASIANAWNSSPFSKIINAVTGLLGDLINVISKIPGINFVVNSVEDFVSKIFSPFVSTIENKVIANPFDANMSGGRTFDEMAAGADVAGNDYAHNGLGGEKLTSQQVATIQNQQQNDDLHQFQKESFFARIFDTSSPYSLVSKLAMDVPIGSAGDLMKSSIASIFSDPLGKLMSGFSSIFSHRTSAATLSSDPFGVTQYGYPASAIPDDPETAWTQDNCGDTSATGPNATWETQASDPSGTANNEDPNTGMPQNTTTDPCMLIQASVGAAGGYFSTSNLSADDLAEAGATP